MLLQIVATEEKVAKGRPSKSDKSASKKERFYVVGMTAVVVGVLVVAAAVANSKIWHTDSPFGIGARLFSNAELEPPSCEADMASFYKTGAFDISLWCTKR